MTSYDDWKTTPPDFYDEAPEYECDHDDADYDLLEMQAICHCGHTWALTAADLDAETRRMAAYYDNIAKEERREFWRRITLPVRRLFGRLRGRLAPSPLLSDDEIPF